MAVTYTEIQSVLGQMRTIDLSEMKTIKLMNRIDTKYMADSRQLLQILASAQRNYRVQNIDTEIISKYDTIYFDTTDVAMYQRHHDRRLQRQKIRTRKYVTSNIAFVEIKNKTNKGRTKKVRTAIDEAAWHDFRTNADATKFVAKRTTYDVAALQPQVHTRFDRITLVNDAKTERLTIDMNLTFGNYTTQQTAELTNLIIIELKQNGQAYSPMKRILRDLRIFPAKISKYCIGTALTNPNVKSNRFKTKIRAIEKITQHKLTRPITK
ncbi:MAG: polyphosphate polymerase domain-containing protein [Paludibacteraceae bacterium]